MADTGYSWNRRMLHIMGNNPNISLDELYKLLATSGNYSGDNLGKDVSVKLLEHMLGYQETKEQRSYDDPSAIVQRLMQAGMSRDAALQAVTNMPTGLGSPISGLGAPLSATASDLNAANANAATQNANAASLQAIAAMSQVGVQMPYYMQLTNGLSIENQVKQGTLDANNLITSAHGIIKRAISDGVISGSLSDYISNKDSIIKCLEGLDKKGFKPASEFLNGDDFNKFVSNPYVASVATDLFHTYRDPEDYITNTILAQRAQRIGQQLMQINLDKMLAEIDEIAARTENFIHDTLKKDSEILLNGFTLQRGQELLPLEKKQFRANIRNTNSQTKVNLSNALYLRSLASYTYQQADSLKMQNDVTRNILYEPQMLPNGKMTTGLTQLSRMSVIGFYENTRELCSLYGNKEWYKHHLNTMFNTAEIYDTYSQLQLMYSRDILNYSNSDSSRPESGLPRALDSYYLLRWFNVAPFPANSGITVPVNGKEQPLDQTIDFVRKYAPVLLRAL